MKFWRLTALPITLFASTALAETWVTVSTETGSQTQIDKDSIRRGSDGLVYFDLDDGIAAQALAADCRTHVAYMLKLDGVDNPDWRDHGKVDDPNSTNEYERAEATALQYVCAHAG